jgi:predicted O-linked N-acetylglucosamine transferase (SPINDLY family)
MPKKGAVGGLYSFGMLGWLRRRRGLAAARRLLDDGVALEGEGRIDDAERAYRAALAVEPGNPYALFNLGRLAYLRGQAPQARERLAEALRRKPDFADAQVVLASVHEALGDDQAALRCLETAVRLHPGYEGAQRNLGLLHVKLGSLRFEQGRLADARQHFTRAAAASPALAEAHAGLGNVCVAELMQEEAARHYRRALEIDPRLAHVHVNLGNALAALGQASAARASYEAALALDPENIEARWCRAVSTIPALRESADELPRSRAALAEELDALERWFCGPRAAQGHRVVGLRQPFWLAYQEERNVDLLRSYGGLCARLMASWPGRRPPPPPGARASGKVRVGVVSQHLRHHSIWHALVKGWFEQLDRERFELCAFGLSGEEDDQTRLARSRAARFEQGPRPLEQWVDAILAARPDVLLYPEIGIDPMSLKLACQRLAPLQATSWGHPETSGLPTIDCYLSAEDFEPEGAQASYTEALIALPHLGCHVRREAAAAEASLEALGLERGLPLLVCPGTPFKYAPEHDGLLVRIARELGPCRLVFFTHGMPELQDRLQRRLAAAFAAEGLDAAAHVRVLPWLTRPAFLGLMQQADAYLDTIGFSGFNTALQAIQCGLPVVTREGRFLRGRLASGILRRLGMPELVARDDDQYVAFAAQLCRDPGYRAALGKRMASACHVLFEDAAPIRALEALLLARCR